jgi:hypothetical protein
MFTYIIIMSIEEVKVYGKPAYFVYDEEFDIVSFKGDIEGQAFNYTVCLNGQTYFEGVIALKKAIEYFRSTIN